MSERTRHFLIALSAALAVFFCILLYYTDADAGDFYQLREVSIDARQYLPGGSYPLITDNGIPDRALDKELDLHIDSDLFRYLYWNNTIHSMTDKGVNGGAGQYRLVGLEFGFGARLAPGLELGYYHFSQHELDGVSPWRFPLQNAVQFKLFLFRSDSKPSIF